MDQSLLDKVIERVASEMKANEVAVCNNAAPEVACTREFACGTIANPAEGDTHYFTGDVGVTEFLGTAMGNTIGLVIPSVDPALAEALGAGKYRAIGILGSRTGVGPQMMAMDDAVKATRIEMISAEPTKDDTSCGQGVLFIVGAEDVSDVRRGIALALENVDKYFGDVYMTDHGHLEFQYTARASHCIHMCTNAPVGEAFGLIVGAPAAIGVVLADTALKAANVKMCNWMSPTKGEGWSFSNEGIASLYGDSGAVRQAVRAAIATGKKLLASMGGEVVYAGREPYI